MAERSQSTGEYQPGYCNIGRDERRKRYIVASVSLVAALGYLGAVVVFALPLGLLLGLFALLSVAIEWYIQARTAFCARFALLGKYDFTGSGGQTGTVEDSADKAADRQQAFRITAGAITLAAALTLVVYLAVDALAFA